MSGFVGAWPRAYRSMVAAVLTFAWCASGLASTVSVKFDRDVYVVNGPGESFDAWVLIDYPRDTADQDPVPAGLFSMGVEMTYPAEKARMAGMSGVSVVDELAHFAFTPNPLLHVAPGEAAAKGNIDVGVDPQTPYTGRSLVKFTLTNAVPGRASYPLALGLFRTLGLNEQIFLDGFGNSLDDQIHFGNAVVVVSAGGPVGDFNQNGMLDAGDLDLQAQAMKDQDVSFDLNGDGVVDQQDRLYWVHELKQTYMGDADLDGEFNSGDLVKIFTAGKYETRNMATWAEGDWNGDMLFDSGDLVAAFIDGGYELGPRAATKSVPEPTSMIVLLGLLAVLSRRSRRNNLFPNV